MNKKIIALALTAMLSGGALAQSNVQIYGTVDVGYLRFSADERETANHIDNGLNSPSRLGFKGSEDLGNGLKALFTLEYNIAPDQNSGIGDAASKTIFTGTQARQQFIGLSGGFGTLLAGRLQTAGFDFACSYSPVAGAAFNVTERMKASTVLQCGTGGRRDNAVAYVSPSFGGLTFAVNHARVTENAATSTVSDAYANLLAATYANGPLKVGAVYAKVEQRHTLVSDDIREYGLGAAYDFGFLKAFAMYQNQKQDDKAGKDSKWALGIAVPVTTKDVLKLAYGQNRIDSTAQNKADAKAFTALYNHSLSKRTTLYAGWTHVRTEKNGFIDMASGLRVGGADFNGNPIGTATGNLLGAGVTHAF